jgi:hypothetical protein
LPAPPQASSPVPPPQASSPVATPQAPAAPTKTTPQAAYPLSGGTPSLPVYVCVPACQYTTTCQCTVTCRKVGCSVQHRRCRLFGGLFARRHGRCSRRCC